MEKKLVKGKWMVLYSDISSDGGVIDYPKMQIIDFYDTEQDAIKQAETMLNDAYLCSVMIVRCERTYQNIRQDNGKTTPGYAYSKY